MSDKKDFVREIEKHETKDTNDGHKNGSLTVIWRDYDKIISNHPKMVYVSSVNSGEIKGPHLHTKRNSYFFCIHGKVTFIIKNEEGKYFEIEADAENPSMIIVPKGIASAHINNSSGIARILALADIAWRADDNEMQNVNFKEYDWEKWK